jgi:hypothetical protein
MPEQIDFAKIPRSEVEELFPRPGGPKSDSRKATETLKYRPDFYHAAKQNAVYILGTVSESMLPTKYRISKADLETKRRADLAAQKDELITLPEELSDRLHLPLGTRMSFAQIQTALGRRVE